MVKLVHLGSGWPFELNCRIPSKAENIVVPHQELEILMNSYSARFNQQS